MPKTSSANQAQRMLSLIGFLQSGKRYNARQLSELCGVSRRTMFRDFDILQEAGLPAHFDQKQQAYWLPGKTILPPAALALDEALALLVLCQNLGGENGVPFQMAAHAAATKIACQLPSAIRTKVQTAAKSIRIRIQRKENPPGQRAYEQLVFSLQNQRCVRISYEARDKTIRTKLSPAELFFSRARWYVIGRSAVHRSMQIIPLDQILDIEAVEDTNHIPPRFSLDRFLGNAWHLMRKKPRVNVCVRFAAGVAAGVADVHWHKTQRIAQIENGAIEFHAVKTVSVD